MRPTEYTEINELLGELVEEIRGALGDRLVGLYLSGSLVCGDFDMEISDIDLVAATRMDIDQEDFAKLDEMQKSFVGRHRKGEDHIEIIYLSLDALRTFRTQRSPIAIISPGEPFHIKDAGNDWLINWYLVREKGVVLYGVDPKTILEPISKEEFIEGVKRLALDWREWIVHTRSSRAYQGYAILSMCRALYACRNGEQVSKKKAAEWAMRELPEEADQIRKALRWRDEYRNKDIDDEATYEETVRFVEYVNDRIGRLN